MMDLGGTTDTRSALGGGQQNLADLVTATQDIRNAIYTLQQTLFSMAFAGTSTVTGLGAAGTQGRRAFVTDANATTFASVVANGGANFVPVYDDGTNWRIG